MHKIGVKALHSFKANLGCLFSTSAANYALEKAMIHNNNAGS